MDARRPLRVVVASHALVVPESRTRWRRLAERWPVEVTLLVPDHWESSWFGSPRTWRSEPRRELDGRFTVLPLPVTNHQDWERYLWRSADAGLRALRPDVVFVAQEELTFALQQMILYQLLWARQARLAFFTWNNLGVQLAARRNRLLWASTRRATDLAIAGNREAAANLRAAGYTRGIHVQTEIGVDEVAFAPDPAARAAAREQLGLSAFTVGFAGRVAPEKGFLDLVRACRALEFDWNLLVVGDGPDLVQAREALMSTGDAGRARFVGEIPPNDMPEYVRAMDVLVLPSRTTPTWKEQFGLVLAQAMLCEVPVIGSTSGAIPEVLGTCGRLFTEGDVQALSGHIAELARDPGERRDLAQSGRERALARFSCTALADETFALFTRLARGRDLGSNADG